MRTYKEREARIKQKAEAKKRERYCKITLATAIACPLAAVITLGLVLFTPYNEGKTLNIARYKDSEYYSVIKTVGGLTYDKPHKTNNFKKWFDGMFAAGSKGSEGDLGMATQPPTATAPGSAGMDADASGSGETGTNGNYQEVTNNQTDGVTEGDLFKRTGRYAFYLNTSTYNEYVLQVTSIAGSASARVAEYSILPEEGTSFAGYVSARELYLSEDGNTVTVVTPCYNSHTGLRYTAVIGIDVSDLTNIREINRSYISGGYVSSRIVESSMLVVSNFSVRWNPDFSNEAEFLPQTGSLDDLKSISVENIVCPEDATRACYTVVCSLDKSTFEVKDSVALLSFSDEVYVSQNNLYAYRTVLERKAYGADNRIKTQSEISRVAYADGELGLGGSYRVDGTILNRYSMDEYEGVLRVFTTTRDSDYSETADLTCLAIESGETLAHKAHFAPKGESVQSARFYGTTAYVCTAITHWEFTDPVFAFDLSDYSNITSVDTGTISGYSFSLTKFTQGTLLGIGYGDTRSDLKIELYRENGADVSSVAKFCLQASFSTEYKAHFIDAKNGLIGLGVGTRGNSYYVEDHYLVLRFDGYELVEVANVKLNDYEYDEMRAFYDDGYLYLFGRFTFEVVELA